MTPRRSIKHRLLSPVMMLLLASLFWAGNTVIARGVVGEVPPFALSFWRWLLALVFLLPVGIRPVQAQWPLVRRQLPLLAALAATSVAAYNTLLYLALQTTTAINATLVASSMPVMIILLSWVWLGERVGWAQALGVLLSLIGVVAVIARGDFGLLADLRFQTGDLWVLAAVFSWAVYSVMLRRHPTGLTPMALLTVLVALGVPFILPFYVWEMAQGLGFAVTPTTLMVMLYVGLFPSVLAYYFWNEGVAAVGANTAGLYAYLMPVFTAFLAVLFLGEALRWFHIAGLALIVLGIGLARRR